MDIIGNRETYPRWFNTPADKNAWVPAELSAEASQWNVARGNGSLLLSQIKDGVFHNAHNQNVYLESIEQRLEAMEADPRYRQPFNRHDYIAIQNELAEVKATTSEDDEFSAVFNDKLTLLSARAGANIVSDDPPPGANR